MPLNKIRKKIRDYFGFSKTETNGMLAIIPFNGILVFVYVLFGDHLFYTPYVNGADERTLDSISVVLQVEPTGPDKPHEWSVPDQTFGGGEVAFFDPHEVSEEFLISVGVRRQVAERWVKYINNGGKFEGPDDIGKIYGLTEGSFRRLSPRVRINRTERNVVGTESTEIKKGSVNNTFLPAKKEDVLLDLNEADTTTLKEIRGIGKVLSKRIVRYRELLGGFVDSKQLYEVYGLDSQVVEKVIEKGFVSSGFVPKKLNINSSDAKDLARHPYIGQKEARLIVSFREQHGPFTDLSQLKKVPPLLIVYEKAGNYLSIGD